MAPAGLNHLRLWRTPGGARAVIEGVGVPPDDAGELLRDAVNDGVPLRLIEAGRRHQVEAVDLARVMFSADVSLAWLPQLVRADDLPASSGGPDPAWGNPFEVHHGKLREHMQMLALLARDEPPGRRQRGGRPAHAAQIVALAQAARFIRWHGLPTPAADLVRFMLEQLARRGIDAPDQRTVEHWARVVCEIAREPIADGAG